jgi:hypothetical protein
MGSMRLAVVVLLDLDGGSVVLGEVPEGATEDALDLERE